MGDAKENNPVYLNWFYAAYIFYYNFEKHYVFILS